MGGPCRLKTPGKLGKAGPAATDNFQLRPFVLDGREYQSVEQAYQALKFGDAPKHEEIRALRPRVGESASSHGMRCWNAGQTGRGMRDDWDAVKVEVMLRCCRAKYAQHADLRADLVAVPDDVEIAGGPSTKWRARDGRDHGWAEWNGRIQRLCRDELRGAAAAADGAAAFAEHLARESGGATPAALALPKDGASPLAAEFSAAEPPPPPPAATATASFGEAPDVPPASPTAPDGDAPSTYHFDFDDTDAWTRHLADEGYVVLRACVSPREAGALRDGLWDAIEAAEARAGVRRGDASSWAAWRLDRRGFVVHATVTQSRAAWALRAHPRVRGAFAAIWGTRELLTSMDALLVWRPWWRDGSWTPKPEGLHVDQNPLSKSGFACVQGMVPLHAVNDDTGGLVVVPRSHRESAAAALVEALGADAVRARGDFVPVPRGHYAPGDARLLRAEPGDLVLWDSRTVHGGRVGVGPPALADGRGDDADGTVALARMSLTVCMTPRALASDDVQRTRRAGFAAGHTFNHWPHAPRVQNCVSLGYEPIELTPEQAALL